VSNFSAARAAMSQSKVPRYSAAELNRVLDAHEGFVRGDRGGQRAIWRFGQAPGGDFSGRQLANADFTGANLKGARLVRTNFERACLQLADLREVDAEQASFMRADIRGVSLRGANLAGANFDEADLRQAVLAQGGSEDFRLIDRPGPAAGSATDITFEVDFTQCSMRAVRLAKARLCRANFSGAYMAGAELTGADLRGARFRGAILTGAKLAGAMIDPQALATCVVDPTQRALDRAGLLIERLQASALWAASDGVEGGAAELDGEDLRPLGEAFVGRRLPAISARRSCGVDMNFVGAQLQGARFDDADLRGADFSRADLRGACFRGANLRFARFGDADIRALPLASGGACPVDLTGADFAAQCFAASVRD